MFKIGKRVKFLDEITWKTLEGIIAENPDVRGIVKIKSGYNTYEVYFTDIRMLD